MEIKFCKTNYENGSKALYDALTAEGLSCEEKPCLGNCGQCYLDMFVEIDGIFTPFTSVPHQKEAMLLKVNR